MAWDTPELDVWAEEFSDLREVWVVSDHVDSVRIKTFRSVLSNWSNRCWRNAEPPLVFRSERFAMEFLVERAKAHLAKAESEIEKAKRHAQSAKRRVAKCETLLAKTGEGA